MVRFFHSLLAKAYAWSPRALLWTNLALAGWVALATGGAFLVARDHPTPYAPSVEKVAVVSLLVASIFLTTVLALAVPRFRPVALAFHGALLLAGAAAMFVWSVGLLIYGIPTDVRFSWSVGLFTAIVAYAVYVFARYTVPASIRAWPAIYYSPLFALIVAAAVDIGVIVRFTHDMSRHFAG